jgi:hypothetical protein
MTMSFELRQPSPLEGAGRVTVDLQGESPEAIIARAITGGTSVLVEACGPGPRGKKIVYAVIDIVSENPQFAPAFARALRRSREGYNLELAVESRAHKGRDAWKKASTDALSSAVRAAAERRAGETRLWVRTYDDVASGGEGGDRGAITILRSFVREVIR